MEWAVEFVARVSKSVLAILACLALQQAGSMGSLLSGQAGNLAAWLCGQKHRCTALNTPLAEEQHLQLDKLILFSSCAWCDALFEYPACFSGGWKGVFLSFPLQL